MKRSVYSLILSDNVIEAIDDMAYSLGTSRSNLINQILAEKVSLITPEQKIKSTFDDITNRMTEGCYQIQCQKSSNSLSIKSSLKYKYRPTVKYSVELFRDSIQAIGQIRVIFRTQNQVLLRLVNSFFKFWVELEKKYLSDEISYTIEDTRLTRVFSYSSSELGLSISEYIRTFDTSLKRYFADVKGLYAVESIYKEYVSQGILII